MDALVQIIIGAASTGVIGAILAGLFARRKTAAESEQISAEAAKIIQGAAASMVKDLQAENEKLRARLDESDRKLDGIEVELDRTNRQLRITTDAFVEAIVTLKELNVDVSRMIRHVENVAGVRLDRPELG